MWTKPRPQPFAKVRSAYQPDFKKVVVDFAEQNTNKAACDHFGISESNIRRWKRLSKENTLESVATSAPSPLISRKPVRKFRQLYEMSDDEYSSSELDSMPLQKRISVHTPVTKPEELHSQPLSPTKLKVTRHPVPSPAPAKAPSPVQSLTPSEEVCLRWNSHHSNMQSMFPNLLTHEKYVDVTLASEGKMLKCHRMILSSCSTYFEDILNSISPSQHPVLFMKDVPFMILKALCDFMYAGEVHIYQNHLEELLHIAEVLKIKGLAGKNPDDSKNIEKDEKIDEPPLPSVKESRQFLKTYPGRKEDKIERQKASNSGESPKSPQKFREKQQPAQQLLKNEVLLDPLELLEPVYEEPADVPIPGISKQQFQKKSTSKRVKKRKYTEEERKSMAPNIFRSRKGTRSRPNVKIPRFYQTDFEINGDNKPAISPTYSMTDTAVPIDPLMDLEVEEIKAEPIDVDDSVIEYNETSMPGDSNEGQIGCAEEERTHVEQILPNFVPLRPMSDTSLTIEQYGPFKKIRLTSPRRESNSTIVSGEKLTSNNTKSETHTDREKEPEDDPLRLETREESTELTAGKATDKNELPEERNFIMIGSVTSLAEERHEEELVNCDETQDKEIEMNETVLSIDVDDVEKSREFDDLKEETDNNELPEQEIEILDELILDSEDNDEEQELKTPNSNETEDDVMANFSEEVERKSTND